VVEAVVKDQQQPIVVEAVAEIQEQAAQES
jgi:hypothetical protein